MKATKIINSIAAIIILFLPLFSCQSNNIESTKTDQEIVLDVVKPPVNFQSTATLQSDVSQTRDNNGEVYWAHILFGYHPSDSVLENEMRWWIYDVWNSHQSCDGIIISCLDSATLDPLGTAHFAPNGKMINVKDGTPYDEFGINIQKYK